MAEHPQQNSHDKAVGEKALDRLAATLALDEAVGRVRLVSPARAAALEKMGIHTVRDLVTHFPRRYIDMSHVDTVRESSIGESCTIAGVIHEVKLKHPKPKLSLVEIALQDSTGLLMITCFRQPWLADSLKAGMRVAAAGKIEFDYGFKRMVNPFIEVLDDGHDDATGMIIAVHPATEKISTAWMRRLISNALAACRGALDPLPVGLRRKYRLPSRQHALNCIHFPQATEEIDMARRRLVYEEVLLLELYLMNEAGKRTAGAAPRVHVTDGPCMKALSSILPFELTDEQVTARDDLLAAMAAPKTANHMLLGDVGTGKTIISAFGLAACADTGTQALMMAPTEVLARQYGEKIGGLLTQSGVTWEVLTGSTPQGDREAILERARLGTVDVLFGTHALLEDDVAMKDCSFVVIDEQQRFGVDQRAKLLGKGAAPDALFMTATPIPRTLALALYGDLTLSYIKKRPRNAAGNATKVYARTERGRAYDAAKAALAAGHQVYIVCPLVGKDVKEKEPAKGSARGTSPAMGGGDEYEYSTISIEADSDLEEQDDLKAAVKEAQILQNNTFFNYKVALLHGKMSGLEKQEVMQQFRSGEAHVLVATTVIEVGVDVPNATVMIVEDADRFGLSQLHQLRGRVGRGDVPGEVFLISGSKAPTALERLAAMEKTEDGFELATYDLHLRREGDILGNRQHGASMLKLVNVVRDGKIIEAAHSDAKAILEADPLLESAPYRALGREMRVQFKDARKAEGG